MSVEPPGVCCCCLVPGAARRVPTDSDKLHEVAKQLYQHAPTGKSGRLASGSILNHPYVDGNQATAKKISSIIAGLRRADGVEPIEQFQWPPGAEEVIRDEVTKRLHIDMTGGRNDIWYGKGATKVVLDILRRHAAFVEGRAGTCTWESLHTTRARDAVFSALRRIYWQGSTKKPSHVQVVNELPPLYDAEHTCRHCVELGDDESEVEEEVEVESWPVFKCLQPECGWKWYGEPDEVSSTCPVCNTPRKRGRQRKKADKSKKAKK